MPLRIFSGIAKFFGAAAKAAGKGAKALGKGAVAVVKKLGPAVKGAVKGAKNLARQSGKVLGKKSRVSNYASKKVFSFWKKAVGRNRQIHNEMHRLQKQIKNSPNAAEEREFLEEMGELAQELEAMELIRKDAARINDIATQERKHDIPLLVGQIDHTAKIAMAEEKKGILDPQVLRRLDQLEQNLIQKINQDNKLSKSAEIDEFNALKQLIAKLETEVSTLRKEVQTTKAAGDRRVLVGAERRLKEDQIEINIANNVLHVAEKEKVEEDSFTRRANRMYGFMLAIRELENEELAFARQRRVARV